MKWLIWSFEHDAWWKANEIGYTRDLAEAGTYSFAKAIAIVGRANQYRGEKMPNEAMLPDYRKQV